jgi:murein DD-endopeptidase MepM/ murein hydrolase activator NlpD
MKNANNNTNTIAFKPKLLLALTLSLGLGLALAQSVQQFNNNISEEQRTINQLQQQAAQLQQSQQALAARIAETKRYRAGQAARADRLQQNIAVLSSRERQLNDQIGLLSEQIDTLAATIRQTEQKITDTNIRIAETEGRIRALAAKIDLQKAQVQNLMRALQREGGDRYLRLLSRTDSLFDLLVRSHQVNQLGSSDVQVIEQLQANVRLLDSEKKRLDEAVAQLNRYQVQLLAQQDDLKVKRNEYNRQVLVLQQSKGGQQILLYQAVRAQNRAATQVDGFLAESINTRSQISTLNANINASQERIDDYKSAKATLIATEEAEQRRLERIRQERARKYRAQVAAAEAARQLEAARSAQRDNARDNARNNARNNTIAVAPRAGSPDPTPPRPDPAPPVVYEAPPPPPPALVERTLPSSVGGLLWPLPGGQVSDNFGPDGIIISGNAGGAVRAAAAGQVIRVSFLSANQGYSVIIQHSATFATMYFNLQEQGLPSVGQNVERGNRIGYTGGGLETNTLHFKTCYTDGSCANPMQYF